MFQARRFECKHYEEVAKMVQEFKITPEDLTFGKIFKGKWSPVWLVEVHSDKLQAVFKKLSETFANKHTLDHGKYVPHVTLCWLKE